MAAPQCTERSRARARLVAGNLDGDALVALAARVDCIINSANNHLLTPGCTGIAGALLAAGGPKLQAASDEAKALAGGTVAVGNAVWTPGGRLNCAIVHAVGLAYRPKVLATPESVQRSFTSALRVAASHGCQTAAAKLMCARPGYSTVRPEDAPATMLASMLEAVEDVNKSLSCESAALEVLIFVPNVLIPSMPVNSEIGVHRVLLSDENISAKQPLFDRLHARGIKVAWLENTANSVVVEEAMQNRMGALVANRSRDPDGDDAGLLLCRALVGAGFPGHIILYTGRLDANVLADAWVCGACFVTHDVGELETFLDHLYIH